MPRSVMVKLIANMGKSALQHMSYNSSAVSRQILMKFGVYTHDGSESIVAKNSKWLPWKSEKENNPKQKMVMFDEPY